MEEHPIDAALEEAVAALIALGDALGRRSPWDVWRAQQGHPCSTRGPPTSQVGSVQSQARLAPEEIDEVLDAVADAHVVTEADGSRLAETVQ